ncbi:MAG: alpha/beta fold hydrolase [Burkholderiaceae bacterium]|nr:alpha/beta fold hydrolase [Burkholderiaceae bacterium]
MLLHAIATHGDIWQAQATVWSQRWRVLRIDLPGHGASPVPAGTPSLHDAAAGVAAVLDELGIRGCAMVGLSLGGMVAQAFALAFPGRLWALVLANTTARTSAAVREAWSQRLVAAETGGIDSQVAPTLARWFTPSFAAASPLTLDWVGAQIGATPLAGYAAAVHAIQQLDHLDRLHEIHVPTLVVAGREDAAVPPALATEIAARIARSEVCVIDAAAHLAPVEQPVAFTERVGRFLLAACPDEG